MKDFFLAREARIVVLLGLGTLLVAGCASKKYVQEGMSTQEAKISDIETQVEDNQRELRQTGERLDGVSDRAQQAEQAGRQAGSRADEAYELAKGKLLYKVVLSDVAGHFTVDNSALNENALESLNELASRLKKENADVYLEIEGHTDSTGSESHNLALGLRRAESVRRYLNGEQGIPLHRMSVISLGESKPVADNSSKDGRAQNRRVEVRVLS